MFQKKCYYIIVILFLSIYSFIFSQIDLKSRDVQSILKKSNISRTDAESLLLKESGFDLRTDQDTLLLDSFDSKLKVEEQIKEIELKNAVLNEKISISSPVGDSTDSSIEESSYKTIKIKKEEDEIDLNDFYNKKNHFGYNIFSTNPEVFQKTITTSADPGYLLGPGDEIVVLMWGETEINKTYIVSLDGYVFIKNVGQVFVNGLTLEKLEQKLFKLLKKVYSSLGASGSASTSFDVSLGSFSLRPIRITLLGEIFQPGAYSIKSSSTLFSSLFYSGGPSVDGSLRKIQLIRGTKTISEIDFYDYLLFGKKNNDIRLQQDDVVFLPMKEKTVQTIGSIKREKFFELKNDESLYDLIQIAGGLKKDSYAKRAQINRIIPIDKRNDSGIDREIIDVDILRVIKQKDKFFLEDGDIITFFSIKEYTNQIEIYGNVKRPGIYQFDDRMYLNDAILKADGLMPTAYLERAEIIRKNEDFTDSLITFSLKEALKGDSSQNIKLKEGDKIKIYNANELFFDNDIFISGHVKSPGQKDFLNGMTLYDIIFMNGGLEDSDYLKKTYTSRAELVRIDKDKIGTFMIPFNLNDVLNKKGKASLKLEMGDKVRIFSNVEIYGEDIKTVLISGNVKRPGAYPIHSDLTIKDLLFTAGGFDDEIFFQNIFLDRADLVRIDKKNNIKKVISFDLGELLNAQNPQNNIIINELDEIRIYSKDIFKKMQYVEISGEIKSPNKYELKKDMRVLDLILEAGGVEGDLQVFRVEVGRIGKFKNFENSTTDIMTLDFVNSKELYAEENDKNIFLKSNDIITVRKGPFSYTKKIITIEGEVYYPGEYVIEGDNEMVSDIINRAGGLTPDAYSFSSQFIRNDETIKLSFDDIIKRPKTKQNFSVKNGDKIIIGSLLNIVKVKGEVNSPGNFQYLKGSNIRDYIEFAGGLTPKAGKNGIYITYPNGQSKVLKVLNSPKVLDGSVITITSKEETEPFNMTEYITNLTSIYSDLMQAYLVVLLATRTN